LDDVNQGNYFENACRNAALQFRNYEQYDYINLYFFRVLNAMGGCESKLGVEQEQRLNSKFKRASWGGGWMKGWEIAINNINNDQL